MKMNKNLEEEIIKLSFFHSQLEIAKTLNLSKATIGRCLRKNNINTNRNRLNESKLKFNINYFDNIDTEEKAYWLGFISADGCLKDNKLRLVSKDFEIIEKFKKSLESEHKIVESTITDKRSGKKYKSYILSITNYIFTKKLEKYINVDKSINFILPNINEDLYSHFIAGMFDGDGSFTIYGKNDHKIRVSLISTKKCLEQIQEILIKLNFSKTKIQEYKKYNKLFLYKDALNFLDYIYKEKLSNMYLSRKYNKYKKYKNEKTNFIL